MVLHRPGIRTNDHVYVDVHRRSFSSQSHYGDGLPTGYVSQTLPRPRLGHANRPDGHLGRFHGN